MFLKRVLSNTRGEAASLVILVSMVVITLGVLTGSRLLEQRLQTSSRASVSPTPNSLNLNTICKNKCEILGYDQGICSGTSSCSGGTTKNQTYSCTVNSACCCSFNSSASPVPLTPTGSLTPTPTPKVYTMSGEVKYANGVGTEGIVVKLYVYTGDVSVYKTETTTNHQGKYVFSGLLPGIYDVKPQSTIATVVTPATQTMVLSTAPYVLTVPLFTASGSPTSTPIITSTITPVPSTITATPSATLMPSVSVTPIQTLTPNLTITTLPSGTPQPSTISATLVPSTTITPPVNCLKKNRGDADCKKDNANRHINILDYAIWYSEFIKGCSETNKAACGKDDDGNGDPMDANFNYPGTPYFTTDMKVSIYDYAVWIQGLVTEIDGE